MDFGIKMTGFKKLDRQLRKLPGPMAKKALRKGLRAGAKIIQAEAKVRVPKVTGALRKSIRVRAARKRRGTVGVTVTTGQKDNAFVGDTYYGGMVEFGTSRMTARPFMQPAFDAKKQQALDVIRRVTGVEIEKAAARG